MIRSGGWQTRDQSPTRSILPIVKVPLEAHALGVLEA